MDQAATKPSPFRDLLTVGGCITLIGVGLSVWGFHIEDFYSPTAGAVLTGVGVDALAWLAARHWFGLTDSEHIDQKSLTAISACAVSGGLVAGALLLWPVKQKEDVEILSDTAVHALVAQSQYADEVSDEILRRLDKIESNLTSLRNDPDVVPKEVESALAALLAGNSQPAETLFENRMRDLERRGRDRMGQSEETRADGLSDIHEAAVNARRLGVLTYLSDTARSIMAFRKAIELDPGVPNDWLYLGQLYRRKGDLGAAHEALAKSIDLAMETGNKRIFAEATGQEGVVLIEQGRWQDAEDTLYRGMALANKAQERGLVADQYGNLGIMYRRAGDLDRSVAGIWNSKSINQSIGRKESLANDYLHIGNIYSERGLPNLAARMYKKSQDLFKKTGRMIGFATAQSNWAMNVVDDIGTVRAEHLVRDSLQIEEDLGHTEGVARNNANLGILYLSRNELMLAKEQFEKALSIYKDISSSIGQAKAYMFLGDLYAYAASDNGARGFKEGRMAALREAEQMYSEAEDRFLKAGHFQWYSLVIMRISAVYVERGEVGTAIDTAQFAEQLLDRMQARAAWEQMSSFLMALQRAQPELTLPQKPPVITE